MERNLLVLGVPNLGLSRALLMLAVLVASTLPIRASAIPVFAHRFGFTCQQCHTTVPQLNGFGKAFLAGGLRLPGGRGVFPAAIKVESAYSSGGNGESLPKAIVDEVELLSAGSAGRNAWYWFEHYAVDGGLPGRTRDAFVDVHQMLGRDDGADLHARLGEFTLPLPVDPETQRPTLANYAIFGQTVGANDFTLFADGAGAEVSLLHDGSQAHLSLLRQGDVMASVSTSLVAGWTAYAYRYRGVRPFTVAPNDFYRQGYAIEYVRAKFEGVALTQTGNDSNSNGFGTPARSSGGFVQAGFHFSPAASLYVRHDDVSETFDGRQWWDILSLVLRPSRNTRLTLEGSRSSDRTYEISTGLLFAY